MNVFKGNKKKRNIIIVVGILVIFIFIFLSFRNGDNNESQYETVPKNVKVIEINEENQATSKLRKTVLLSSVNSAEAVTEYAGRIKRVNFEVGDYVRAGQILAEFDQSDISNTAKLSLNSLNEIYSLTEKNLKAVKNSNEESVEIAKKNVNKAEIDLREAESGGTADEIASAKEDLKIAKRQEDKAEESAKSQKKAAEIQLEQARLNLETGRSGYDKTLIKAPISGNIVSKNISLDDYLGLSQVVAQIVKPGKLETKIYLTGNEVSRVRKGDKIVFKKNNIESKGVISGISSLANQDNQRFEVLIETNENVNNLINQTVEVDLNLRLKYENGFFVPLEAVNVGQKRREVFVVVSGKANLIEVQTGDIIGNNIEIVSGLNEGDVLIVEGNKNLRHEEEINIKK